MPLEIKKKMEFAVRPAEVFDVPGMVQLQRAAVKKNWSAVIGDGFQKFMAERLDPAEQMDKYKQRIDDPGRFLLIVENGDEMAGFGGARVCADDDVPHGYDWQVSAFYIAPEYEGKGAGKLLFATMLDLLRAGEVPSLALWCLEGNSGARKFYEKAGGTLVTGCETPADYAAVAPHVVYGWKL